MKNKKVIIPLLCFLCAIVAFAIGQSFAINMGTNHSGRVVVNNWSLIDPTNIPISNTHGATYQSLYVLDFDWTLTAPIGTTFSAGDHFHLNLPSNSNHGSWTAFPVGWTNFTENGSSVVLGRYRITSTRIEVELNSSVNGKNQIGARFITTRTVRNNSARGQVQTVSFGGRSQNIFFYQFHLSPMIERNDFNSVRSSTDRTIRFATVIGQAGKVNFARTNTFTPLRNVYIEETLTGEFEALQIAAQVYHPADLANGTVATQSAASIQLVDNYFTRVEQNTGESYTQFRNRLAARQWGVFTNNQGVQTFVVFLGDIGDNGIRYLDASPNAVQAGIDVALTRGVFGDADVPALRSFHERMMGFDNAVGGEVLTYHVHVTQTFPPVTINTQVTSTVTLTINGVAQQLVGTGTLVPASGVGVATEGVARVYLRDQDTNVALSGANFRLQMMDVNGVFIPYTSWAGGTTNEQGVIDTPLLGEGTYRFIQLTTSSQDYDLSISQGFDASLNTVVSSPFTIEAGITERKVRNVTNRIIRRCITYVPGDCGTFTEQRTCDLLVTGSLPDFVGTPSGENNCVFDGWDEEEDNNRNITRTARWRRVRCVTYLPGECGVFTEQRTCNLPNPGEIPEFNGTPNGEDACEFDGWNRGENEDGDITYTARWNRRNRSRVFLNAEDTGELLSGVPFVLQRRTIDGLWLDYPNWSGGDTNEYGYVTTPYKGRGVYRFVQRGIYSDDFDLSISRGFDPLLMTVISNEFTIESDDAEGHTLFVTNARRRFCVTYRPGDCGVFEEQETCDVMAGGDMPEFNGTPEGEYICEFDGWDRIETEDGDIIYTARWNRRSRVPDTLANIPTVIYVFGGLLIISGITILIKNIKRKNKLSH